MGQTASNTTPNDINASLYDMVYSQVKDERETDAEIDLVAGLVSKGSKVLELGCGTGRHLIKLRERGFDVTGIDNSKGMLTEAENKIKDKGESTNISLIHADILTYDFQDAKYNLIASFWNGINEFALRDEDLSAIFLKLKSILRSGGKMVFNTEDLSLFDPSKLDYELKFSSGKMQWTLKSYDPTKRTTVYEEKVTMDNGRTSKAEFTQRWWSTEALGKAGSEAGLTMEVRTVPENEELYLVFSKD